MKVLIPILGFGRSGGNRVLSELANQWINCGHEVDFLVSRHSDSPYFPTTAKVIRISDFGVLVNHLDDRSAGSLQGWRNLFALWVAISRMAGTYDVILANHSFTAWPVRFSLGSRCKKFYYIQAYEPDYYSYDKKIKSRIFYWMSRLSYCLKLKQIVNSRTYAAHGRIDVGCFVPPGVDFSKFYRKENFKNLLIADEIIVGCIGRSEPSKGIIYALHAFEELYRVNKKMRLRVAYGNLPMDWSHPACEVVIPRDDNELADYYRSIDIIIAPGIDQHGAPHYPVMEAMACGVPVVTTGYLPADSENGWIVEPKRIDQICEAVFEIVNGHEIDSKLEKAGKDISIFGWDSLAQRMMDIFRAGVHANEKKY